MYTSYVLSKSSKLDTEIRYAVLTSDYKLTTNGCNDLVRVAHSCTVSTVA